MLRFLKRWFQGPPSARAALEAEIAQRRQIEAELRRERERLQTTLTSIGDAVVVTDAEGRVTFQNPVAEGLTGWRLEEVAGKPLTHIFRIRNEQTGQPLEDPVAKVLATGRVCGLANHTVLTNKDGTVRPIDDSAAPIRDEQGNIGGVVLVFRDVTERRRAEEARTRLAAIVDSSEDAIIGKTLDGIIVTWNKGAQRLYGYTSAEIVGRPISLLVPPEHPDEIPAIMERLRQGERVKPYETVRLRKDGTLVEVSLCISPIKNKDGEIAGASAIARDITAAKQAAEALRESEGRKTAMLNVALDAIITMDHNGSIIEFNAAAERMFGHRRDDVLGRQIADLLIPPSLRERHQRGLAHYLATGEGPVLNKRIEMPALRADGSEFPVELAIAPIATSGSPVFTAYVRDLTERKRIERRRSSRLVITQILAQSSTLQDAAAGILQAVCDGLGWDMGLLWLVDPAAEVLRCHAVWHSPSAQVAGFERSSRESTFVAGIGLPGRVWSNGKPVWIPDVGKDENFPRAAVAQQDGLHGAFGCAILRSEGILGVLEFFSSEVREPDPDLLEMMATVGGQIGQFIDRLRTEEELRQAGERMRSVVNHVVDGIITIDEHGDVESFNPAAEKLFGYTRSEVVHQNVKLLMPEPYHGQHDGYIRNYLNTGQAKIIGIGREVVGRRKDGSTFPMELAVSEFQIGSRRYFTGIVRDISERKRLEQELRQRLDELAEADRRKDEFLAMLAHELRNPLAPIRNALHLMKMPGANSEDVEQAWQITDRQVQYMVRLVDDLLDVSRIMRGRIELRKQPVELATIIACAVETAQPILDAQGQALILSVSPEPLWVEGDPIRLTQVIANLLNNAAKFSDQAERIWLTAERQGDEAVLRIRDEGAGIAPDLLPYVFDLFVQGDKSLERSQGGLGIGLTVARKVMELHGGRVTVVSEGPAKGSEFTVRLPVLQEAAGREEPGPQRPEYQARASRRILVVDDNVDAAESIAVLLRLWGHDVRVAYTGPEALQVAQEYLPEVMVLDIGLPGMNGYEVARQLRQQSLFQGIVLAAVTGYGQDNDRRRSEEAGFDHHLTKPVDPETLQAVIAS